MYYISKETELTPELLHKYINDFVLNRQPKMKKWKDYYDGKHVILEKTYADKSKPCSRIVTNFCKVITDAYAGYIAGKPIAYVSNDDIEEVQECINYNDTDSEDINWLNNALQMSVGYELFWLDEESQVRYSQVNPLNAFAIYDNTLDANLLYFVRWYDAEYFDDVDRYIVEVYSQSVKKKYRMEGTNGGLTPLDDEAPHNFNDVPVSVFYLNETEESIFNCIMTLQDAYNELQSSEVDDYSAWVDAYLLLTGAELDSEGVADMKTNRVLMLPEGASADWLVKNASDTQIVNMLENIKENIFKISACPDMADETFLAQSGTALAYKIVNFENVASGIVARFTKAIQRRIELICNILNIKATEAVWRDVGIKFTRNLPTNITETIQLVNSLKGIVSDATLLSQLPFIDDVNAELEAVAKQKEESMALYSFGNFDTEEDTEEEVE